MDTVAGSRFVKPRWSIPTTWSTLWRGTRQSFIVVHAERHLAVFIRVGGNASVHAPLARRYLRSMIDAQEVAPDTTVGFVPVETVPSSQLRRRPTRGTGKRVYQRDSQRCIKCGGGLDFACNTCGRTAAVV